MERSEIRGGRSRIPLRFMRALHAARDACLRCATAGSRMRRVNVFNWSFFLAHESRLHPVPSQSVEAALRAAAGRGRCALPRLRADRGVPVFLRAKYQPQDGGPEQLFALRDRLVFYAQRDRPGELPRHRQCRDPERDCANRTARRGGSRWSIPAISEPNAGPTARRRHPRRALQFPQAAGRAMRRSDKIPRSGGAASQAGWHVVVYFESRISWS